MEQDNPKAQQVLRLFLKKLKFKNASLDEALRSMVVRFRLPGEAQQMDRFVPFVVFQGPSNACLIAPLLMRPVTFLGSPERVLAAGRVTSLF